MTHYVTILILCLLRFVANVQDLQWISIQFSYSTYEQKRTYKGLFAAGKNDPPSLPPCLHGYKIIRLNRVKSTFFTQLQRLLLTVSGLQPAALLKKRLGQRCLSVSFAKFLITSFVRTPPDDCFLCLSVNFEKFFRSPLLQSTSGKLLILFTSCKISTATYSQQVFLMCFIYKKKNQLFKGIHVSKILENHFEEVHL